jgi:hypothetical protein
VIRARADDAHLDAILGIPPRETVEAVDPLARVQVIARPLAIDGEGVRIERDIDAAPPDVLLRVVMLYHPLVLGRAPRLGARVGDQRAVLGDAGVFLITDGVLVERAGRKVAVNLLDGQLVFFQIE